MMLIGYPNCLIEHIVHHILSFLPTSNAIRVSVLSKAWYDLFNAFRMSDFFDYTVHLYYKFNKGPDRMPNFATFVNNSLLKQCRQNSCIPKFRFSVELDWSWTPQLLNLVDHCIQLATHYGVKELDLKFDGRYHLPQAIFSAKELVVCGLARCNFNFPHEASVNWPSLRELVLREVQISDTKIFDNLVSGCPLMEKISLVRCSSLSYLRLSGFTELKEVKVEFNHSMKKIEIDILSLRTFYFLSGNYKETLLDLTTCKNLQLMSLIFYFSQDSIRIQDVIPQFPALEVLIFEAVNQRSVNISSQQLEKLQLSTAFSAETINIDAPRLRSFRYDFGKFPSWFSLNRTSLQEVALKLDCYTIFHKFSIIEHWRDALVNFKQMKLHTLVIECCWRNFYAIPEIVNSDIEPVLPDIKHVKLKVDLKSDYIDQAMIGKAYEVVVEGLLRMCHSESLVLLKSGLGTDIESVKILCKRLMRSYPRKKISAA